MAFKDSFSKLYKNLKLSVYKSLFKRIEGGEKNLSSTEFLCLECIYLMDKPTISQFAQFLDISSPNATYRIKSLVKKGYLSKERSDKDGREYILVPTQKFFDLYEMKEEEIIEAKKLTKRERKNFEKIMDIITSKEQN